MSRFLQLIQKVATIYCTWNGGVPWKLLFFKRNGVNYLKQTSWRKVIGFNVKKAAKFPIPIGFQGEKAAKKSPLVMVKVVATLIVVIVVVVKRRWQSCCPHIISESRTWCLCVKCHGTFWTWCLCVIGNFWTRWV